MSEKSFTWVEAHKQITNKLVEYKNRQPDLIHILELAGVSELFDEDKEGEKSKLIEIDPFTFYSCIYKYGSIKRLDILQKVVKAFKIEIDIKDTNGIPGTNALSALFFPFKYNRIENEIEKLWDFYFAALEDRITNQQYLDVLNIFSVANAKLTAALFCIDPEKYLPLNGPVVEYLKNIWNIDSYFTSIYELENILQQVKEKIKKPFYEISYDAKTWSENPVNDKEEKKVILQIIDENLNAKMESSKNVILYGPPGTGKTFATIDIALRILGIPENDLGRNINKGFFEKKISEGKIVFTTFHQNMSYEDFIEGIKPVLNDESDNLKYKIEDGIFKSLCKKGMEEYYKLSNLNDKDSEVYKELLFDSGWNNIINQYNQGIYSNEDAYLSTLTKKTFKIANITNNGNFKLIPIFSDNNIEYTVSYNRAKKLFQEIPDLKTVENIDKKIPINNWWF